MKRIKSNATIWVIPYKRKKKTLKNRSDSEHSSGQRGCVCVCGKEDEQKCRG